MAIPGSVLNGLNFDPAHLGVIAYPSVCTFYQLYTADGPSGQELHTFVAMTGAHAGIPCRQAPNILIRPQVQEKPSGLFQMEDARTQVNLSRYVADASDAWQLMVDGVLYEIIAVENDGSKLTTRIGIGKIIPFNS